MLEKVPRDELLAAIVPIMRATESDQGVTIVLESFGAAGGHAQGDTLYSIKGLIGSDRTDYVYGDFERNLLRGEGGDDDLEGRAAMIAWKVVVAETS